MLQNLASLVAAHVLCPTPGSRVLDMCAAPGGKTTMLAQLMGDRGEVVAFDRSHAKVGGWQSGWQGSWQLCLHRVGSVAMQPYPHLWDSQPGGLSPNPGWQPAARVVRCDAVP
jgi:hypothetical protein